MQGIRFFSVMVFMFLGGCSVVAENTLDLTFDGPGKSALPVTVKIPEWYGNPYAPQNPVRFFAAELETDADGHLRRIFAGWYAYPSLAEQLKGVRKPMFFLDFPQESGKCSLVLWYLEDKEFFVPLAFENDSFSPLPHSDDVSGSFTRRNDGKGWEVKARILRTDRLCPEKETTKLSDM
ncbi:MAG: hypothetical protein ACI4PW_04835 [Alphaproteobacteria bacterium]